MTEKSRKPEETAESRVFRDMMRPAFDPSQFRLYRGEWPRGRYFCDLCRLWHADGAPPCATMAHVEDRP